MSMLASVAPRLGGTARSIDPVWGAITAILGGLAIASPEQAGVSLAFLGSAFASTGAFLLVAVALAAAAKATGADGLIARAFQGRELYMVGIAALIGALSPFCSCGVIPLILALLAMGVPLSAVMAFWLASPLMDPAMFVVTSAVLGTEFAIVKTVAAIGIGAFGGYATMAMTWAGAFAEVLKPGVGDGGCGGAKVRTPGLVVWPFWRDPARRSAFGREARTTGLFLLKWLSLAFLLESLMVAWIPAESIAAVLGGDGLLAVPIAVAVGVPAYLNGYAALGLVNGLLQGGMAPGAGLAFLIAGGVTSLPAAMAVYALARTRVFLWYLALAGASALIAGFAWQAWLAL